MQKINNHSYLFDDFFVGFSIPQIGKEFDFLRFGENSIVNIELKQEATEEKVLNQLIKNKYYLSFLGKNIFQFTYISTENKIYTIDDNNQLKESSFGELVKILEEQQSIKINDIEGLFNPSDYLVSPFNSTDSFIQDKYFLTNRQQEIKKRVFEIIKNKESHLISITGGAGTGKTLLIYDIAKEFIKQQKKVLIIHCGLLNEGHNTLNTKYDWDIQPAKNISIIKDYSRYSLIILDECQRMYPNQLEYILKQNKPVILSYDLKQYLRDYELSYGDFQNKIIDKNNLFELKTKIRTNVEIASFIRSLFDKDKKTDYSNFPNIYINYFEDICEAKQYINYLKNLNWKYINYTPDSRHDVPYENCNIENNPDNSHKVIGQEYDNVIVVLDGNFTYKGNELFFKGEFYYNPTKMLYQNITRVRKQLNVIIVNNPEIFERCLYILNRKDKT